MTTRPGEHPPPEDVDGLLDGDPDELLREHVDSCPHCREVLDRQRALRALLTEHSATPALPDSVALRWQRALDAEPAFSPGDAGVPAAGLPGPGLPAARSGGRGGPGEPPLDEVPQLGLWPSIPVEQTAAARELRAPAAPKPAVPPQRLHRLRMAVALAAGLTVLVGAGAATWTTLARPAQTSSVAGAPQAEDPATGAESVPRAAAPDSAAQESAAQGDAAQESAAQDDAASEGVPPAAAFATPDSQPSPAETPGDVAAVAPDRPTVIGGLPLVDDGTVRALAADGELRWPGVTGSQAARARADACLRSLDLDAEVVATAPKAGEQPARQFIVSQESGWWRVTEVDPACPDGEADPLVFRLEP